MAGNPFTVIRATADHAAGLAGRLRASDAAEIAAASGLSQLDALTFSVSRSAHAFTAMVDGRPEIMFGVSDLNVLLGWGSPWLLGSDAVALHYRAFARESRAWHAAFVSRYRRLFNAVHAENRLSIAWLRYLGFTIHPALPLGRSGALFHPFELEASCAM